MTTKGSERSQEIKKSFYSTIILLRMGGISMMISMQTVCQCSGMGRVKVRRWDCFWPIYGDTEEAKPQLGLP